MSGTPYLTRPASGVAVSIRDTDAAKGAADSAFVSQCVCRVPKA